MTVWPNEDGTLTVIDALGERDLKEWEVEVDPLFSKSDKRFLRDQFKHAHPDEDHRCAVPG